MKHLTGKVALVTGAAMGMGREISALLLAQGCRVAMVDIDPDALARAREPLSKTGECYAFVCDIGDRDHVHDLAASVEQTLGPVNILVNNAGIVRAALLLDLADKDIESMIRVNLTSLFWTCRAFLPGMRASGPGHIVNMASAGGLLAIPALTAYCASKFGVVGFSDALRQELKRERLPIGVTCVCPNTVGTGMFAGARTVHGTRLLRPEMVAAKVIQAIRRNQPLVGVPSLPVQILTPLLKALFPVAAMDRINQMMGMWHINDSWHGRGSSGG
jgi:short-subunit dehydrogenase